MSNKNESRREALSNKFPEMDQHFEELKKQDYEPKIEHLGETKKEQRTRSK